MLSVMEGIMKRGTYTIWFILYLCIGTIMTMVMNGVNIGIQNSLNNLGGQSFIGIIGLLICLAFCYFCAAPRLKDCGKNPWLSLIILIPFVGFIFGLALCFLKRR